MTSFPVQDAYWLDTASFVESNRRNLEPIIAPAQFCQRLSGVCSYTLSLEKIKGFNWAIIHKGKLEELHCELLRAIARKFTPVFANEVFIVFSRHQNLPGIDRTSPHLKAFQDGLKAYQKKVGRSISFQLNNNKFELTIKPKTSPHPSLPLNQAIEAPATKNNQLPIYSSGKVERESVYLGNNRAITKTIWGHKIFVDTEDLSLTPHVLLDGYWEMWITNFFLSVLQEGMTVIDIGANIGYYTLLAASKVGSAGKIYAFEANSQVFENLIKTVEVNGFNHRVTLVNKAAYSHSTPLKFYRFKSHQGDSTARELSIESSQKYGDEVEIIEVAAISLDEYFGETTKIDLIKMDAEGSEMFIFQGMKNVIKNNPQLKVIFEFYPKFILESGKNPRLFLEEIEYYGFQFSEITEDSTLVSLTIDQLLEVPRYRELFISR